MKTSSKINSEIKAAQATIKESLSDLKQRLLDIIAHYPCYDMYSLDIVNKHKEFIVDAKTVEEIKSYFEVEDYFFPHVIIDPKYTVDYFNEQE